MGLRAARRRTCQISPSVPSSLSRRHVFDICQSAGINIQSFGWRFVVERQIRGSAVGRMLHVNACCRQASTMDFRELTPHTIKYPTRRNVLFGNIHTARELPLMQQCPNNSQSCAMEYEESVIFKDFIKPLGSAQKHCHLSMYVGKWQEWHSTENTGDITKCYLSRVEHAYSVLRLIEMYPKWRKPSQGTADSHTTSIDSSFKDSPYFIRDPTKEEDVLHAYEECHFF
ncbi:hypothetical protein EVAR_36584_1 [Eumeta japonica]|uniref:Uncharacterized protein n=1 Tax=Eumeta variegata TaxID=151549 RepID=A0A4C1XQV8_EUMVA|nr:hypothetical protein EVAR_36584_1 [Eumeta japonica]